MLAVCVCRWRWTCEWWPSRRTYCWVMTSRVVPVQCAVSCWLAVAVTSFYCSVRSAHSCSIYSSYTAYRSCRPPHFTSTSTYHRSELVFLKICVLMNRIPCLHGRPSWISWCLVMLSSIHAMLSSSFSVASTLRWPIAFILRRCRQRFAVVPKGQWLF